MQISRRRYTDDFKMESESTRLLTEKATIGMAREILKKATAFFAGTSK
ncbi:MAG: hypothetical protein LBF93_07380 [Zoogloeaceae bacterium]|jgi:transposase-like protein|nr:hypothetical protein [Zoogloeaceae bacterium]